MPNRFHTVPIGEEMKNVLKSNFKDSFGLKTVSFGKIKSFLHPKNIQMLQPYIPGIFLEPIVMDGRGRNIENSYPFCLTYVRNFIPGQEIEKVLVLEAESIAQKLLDRPFGSLLNLGRDGGQVINWEVSRILYDNQTENFFRYISTNYTAVEIYITFEVHSNRR